MANPKVYAYIGFAARARKCLGGFQGVEGAVRSRKAKLVLGDTGLGENTREKLDRMCAQSGIPVLYIDQPGEAAGKHNNMCLAITDEELARAILEAAGDLGGKE